MQAVSSWQQHSWRGHPAAISVGATCAVSTPVQQGFFHCFMPDPVGLEDSGFGGTEEGHLTLSMRASRGSDVSVRQEYVGISQMKGEESYPGRRHSLSKPQK